MVWRCTVVSIILICLVGRCLPGGLAWCQVTAGVIDCEAERSALVMGSACCQHEAPTPVPADPAECCDQLDLAAVPALLPLLSSSASLPDQPRLLPSWPDSSLPARPQAEARPWWPPDPGAGDRLRELRSIRLLI